MRACSGGRRRVLSTCALAAVDRVLRVAPNIGSVGYGGGGGIDVERRHFVVAVLLLRSDDGQAQALRAADIVARGCVVDDAVKAQDQRILHAVTHGLIDA